MTFTVAFTSGSESSALTPIVGSLSLTEPLSSPLYTTHDPGVYRDGPESERHVCALLGHPNICLILVAPRITDKARPPCAYLLSCAIKSTGTPSITVPFKIKQAAFPACTARFVRRLNICTSIDHLHRLHGMSFHPQEPCPSPWTAACQRCESRDAPMGFESTYA